jgi:hypothetical protein
VIYKWKRASDDAKQRLKVEKNRPVNSKDFGQPVRGTIDDILKRHGINRGAHYFGGALEGNSCWKVLSEATNIIEEVKSYVLRLPPEHRVVGKDEEVMDVCTTHWELMTSLDGFLSGMIMIRFHLTEDIVTKTDQYHEQTLVLWRYLGMSVTPKAHCIKRHPIPLLLVHHDGFANLGEDSGEHMHQVQSKIDQRLGAIQGFKKKEVCKSKEETMTYFPSVKIKMEEMFGKTSRGQSVAHAESRATKHQKKLDGREAVLKLPVRANVVMTTLRARRAAMLGNAGLANNDN